MILVVAGMQRSGSTFSYNVAREILQPRGGVTTLATNSFEDVIALSSTTEHFIIKTHEPDMLTSQLLEKNALPCICTIRKPEDAILSWMTVFGFSLENTLEIFTNWLKWHQGLSNHLLNIKYENIDTKPILVIWKIGQYLVRDFGLCEAVKIWRKYRKASVYRETQHLEQKNGNTIDIGFSYYDQHTFFHRRHISSLSNVVAEHTLSKKDLEKIRYTLREFINDKGCYEW